MINDETPPLEVNFYLDLLTHDIKNLNQGACGYLELMSMMPETSESQKKFLEEALSYIRMSNNLIMSIEIETYRSSEQKSISMLEVLDGSIDRLTSLNTSLDLNVKTKGFDRDLLVRGNILWIDLFVYVMDFMIKRASSRKIEIEISTIPTGSDDISVMIKGNMQELIGDEVQNLFSREIGRDKGRGKLVLCRSIVDRFGGNIVYLPGRGSSGSPGEFLITLKEVSG